MNGINVLLRRRLWVVQLPLLALVVFFLGCENQSSKPAAQTRQATDRVYVTFYPTEYFTDRIAGGTVEVVNPCPADADPAFWMPDDAALEKYQTDADLIIINGANFEKWVGKVTLPEARLVDTSASFKDEFIEMKGAIMHSHGAGGTHTHAGTDGHTWLDPANAKRQAKAIEQALGGQYPKQADAFAKNLSALEADLDALSARLEAVSKHMKDQTILANHPAWNYLARSYGWQLKTFHLDPEELPGAEEIEKIRTQLTETPAKFILWEAEPTAEVTALFENVLGLKCIVYTPGEAIDSAERETGEDFLKIMNANVDRLEEAFK